MKKQLYQHVKSLLEAWLSDVWGRGNRPYLVVDTTSPRLAVYATQGDKPFNLRPLANEDGNLLLNLGVDAISPMGLNFMEVSPEEGYSVIHFQARFSQKLTDIYVPLPAVRIAYDRDTPDNLAIQVSVNSDGYPVLAVDPSAEDKELAEFVSKMMKETMAGELPAIDSAELPAIGFMARNHAELYAAMASIGYACCFLDQHFSFAAHSDRRADMFIARGGVTLATKSFPHNDNSHTEFTGGANDMDFSVSPSWEQLTMKPAQFEHFAATADSFSYGIDRTTVSIRDTVQYVTDPHIVEILANNPIMNDWLQTCHAVPREALGKPEPVKTAPQVDPRLYQAPGKVMEFKTQHDKVREPGTPSGATAEVINMAAFRSKKSVQPKL